MSLRLVIVVSCLLWSASASAQMSGGSSPGGTNYSCDGVNCTCNGTYLDCKSMQKWCKTNTTSCTPTNSSCKCDMKPSVSNPTSGQPKRPAPGKVAPATRQ